MASAQDSSAAAALALANGTGAWPPLDDGEWALAHGGGRQLLQTFYTGASTPTRVSKQSYTTLFSFPASMMSFNVYITVYNNNPSSFYCYYPNAGYFIQYCQSASRARPAPREPLLCAGGASGEGATRPSGARASRHLQHCGLL